MKKTGFGPFFFASDQTIGYCEQGSLLRVWPKP